MATFEYQVEKKSSSNPRSKAWTHELYLDGQCLSAGYCIDLAALLRSFEAAGEHFILTCSCGEPGCAGLFVPFQVVHHDDKLIHWRIEQPEPEREFYFSARQAIHSLIVGLTTRQVHGDLWKNEIDVLAAFRKLA